MKHKKKEIKKTKQVRIRKQKEGECFICGATSNLQEHHIIPKSLGGDKLENNKVLLCDNCHKKVHQLLDPVIDYMERAVICLQDKLKLAQQGDLQAPLGFRFYKNNKKGNGGKKK
jgi:transcription elongation factor Elf1